MIGSKLSAGSATWTIRAMASAKLVQVGPSPLVLDPVHAAILDREQVGRWISRRRSVIVGTHGGDWDGTRGGQGQCQGDSGMQNLLGLADGQRIVVSLRLWSDRSDMRVATATGGHLPPVTY
jgi:hypothetical protein